MTDHEEETMEEHTQTVDDGATGVDETEIPPDTTSTEIEEAKPDPMAIAIEDPGDVYRRMSLEDERQILDELQGRALEAMIYSFEIDGKRQTGFSWVGVREAVRTLNTRRMTAIRMSPEITPKIEPFVDEEGEDAIRVTVYAEDTVNGGGNWGVAVCKANLKLRNGRTKPDTFAVHKALSKAQRNAMEPLIPLEAVEYLKAQYHGAGQVKVIPGAATAVEIEKPEPLDDPRAREQLAKLRALYDEIKAVDRLVMPPGAFNAIVQGAQHDHTRLDEAIAHLESFLELERQIEVLREEWRKTVKPEVFDAELSRQVGRNQTARLGRFRELLDAKGA